MSRTEIGISVRQPLQESKTKLARAISTYSLLVRSTALQRLIVRQKPQTEALDVAVLNYRNHAIGFGITGLPQSVLLLFCCFIEEQGIHEAMTALMPWRQLISMGKESPRIFLRDETPSACLRNPFLQSWKLSPMLGGLIPTGNVFPIETNVLRIAHRVYIGRRLLSLFTDGARQGQGKKFSLARFGVIRVYL